MALNILHSVTSKKLEFLYTKPTDETIASASCDTSTSSTLSPPSSMSAPSSHSYGGIKPMPYFTGHSTSLSSSLSYNGMIPTGPVLSPQNDWFSEELDDLSTVFSELGRTIDQETYCLRKAEGSSIIPVPQEVIVFGFIQFFSA